MSVTDVDAQSFHCQDAAITQTFRSQNMKIVRLMYRVLLYAYPPAFRLKYRDEMERLFSEQYAAIARKKNRLRTFGFVWQTMLYWLTSACREWRDTASFRWLHEWAMTFLVYFFVSSTLVQAYVIPTGSMEGNLRVGDHMLVNKTTREVKRGDIVAFLYPKDISQTFVKRVIGLPGDRIQMVNKKVIRNGRVMVEPYTQHVDARTDNERDNFPELIVPPGNLFVLGDNRDNSLDSRYWGFVPHANIVGTPLLVYWSYDASTEELSSWNTAHLIDVAEHFFTKTRWERTFLVPKSQPAE
jgi:signal peptidase I